MLATQYAIADRIPITRDNGPSVLLSILRQCRTLRASRARSAGLFSFGHVCVMLATFAILVPCPAVASAGTLFRVVLWVLAFCN